MLASVHFHRPDLKLKRLPQFPILLNPPNDFFAGIAIYFSNNIKPQSDKYIPAIGELMLASMPPDTSKLFVENDWWVTDVLFDIDDVQVDRREV